jgi:hypothetical protein
MFQAASDGGPTLGPGTYILELQDIEDAEPGQFGPQYRWSFWASHPKTPDDPIRGSDGQPYIFYQWTGTKPTPKSRCRPLIEALYGRPLHLGEFPRADLMIHRRMKVLIIHVNDPNGKTRARISTEVAPKPFPCRGASAVEAVPEPEAAMTSQHDYEIRRRDILGDDPA